MLTVEARALNENLPLPTYGSPGAAAMDLRASIIESITIAPGARLLVKTGFAANMRNKNMVGLIAPRSGLALKHGIQVHPGVIDSDYTGEIGVIIFNFGNEPFTVNPADRIAQILFQPVFRVELAPVDAFSTVSERGANGFGSTGTK